MLIKISENEYVESIYEIEKSSFETPYSKEEILKIIIDETYYHITAFDGEKVVGYLGVKICLDECDIAHIAVSKENQRQGIGQKLIENLIEFCKKNDIIKVHLEVRKSNESAILLYKKCGFSAVGERKEYYKNPTENATLMSLEVI